MSKVNHPHYKWIISTEKKANVTSPQLGFYSVLTGNFDQRKNSNNLFSQSIYLPSSDYEHGCRSRVKVLPDSLISPLVSFPCHSESPALNTYFKLAAMIHHWLNNRLRKTSMYPVSQGIRMHFSFSDDKQRVRNAVSRDSLNKLKVLNGEGRICDRLWQHLLGFPFFGSFLLFETPYQ